MTTGEFPSPPAVWGVRLVPALLAALAYFGTPLFTGEPLDIPGHFPRYATVFLGGHVGMRADAAVDQRVDELIPSADEQWIYLGYPPFPALLLMPLVAVFGEIKVQSACRVVSVLNVLIFDACLLRLPRLLGDSPPGAAGRLLFGAFFSLGTVVWHNSQVGGDWHLAHAVSLGGCLLALCEYAGRRRFLLVGLYLASVVATRPTAALTGVFFVLALLRERRWADLARLSAFPLAAAAALGAYNAVRFGHPLDFGYSRMLLTAMGKRDLETWGKFHPHFIAQNFFWFFLAPPWPPPAGLRWPLAYDPRGLSLFIASPALAYCIVGAVRRAGMPVVQHALAAAAVCLVPLLTYYNAGFWQFGHRFSMDYLNALTILLVAGMGTRPGCLATVLLVGSVVIQAIGVLGNPSVFPLLPEWLAPSP
jgi:hypothetical protein